VKKSAEEEVKSFRNRGLGARGKGGGERTVQRRSRKKHASREGSPDGGMTIMKEV